MMNRILPTLLGLFLLLFLLPQDAHSARTLKHEFTIPLDDSDQVLGDLTQNFVVYGKPTLTVYNRQGKKLYSKRLKNNVRPVVSPNCFHIGLITYADRNPTALKVVKFEKLDAGGNAEWAMENPDANSFYLGNDGHIIGVEGVEGTSPVRIHFLDPYGNPRDILPVKAYYGIIVSPSADRVIIDQARDGSLLYGPDLEKAIRLPMARRYAFAVDNEEYVCSHYRGKLYVYDNGKEVAEIGTIEFVANDLALNVAANRAVLVALKRAEVYDLVSRKMVWQYELLEGPESFTSVSMSGDGRLFACGLDINLGNQVAKEKRHVEGYVYVFETDGAQMIKQHEEYKSWGIDLPRPVLSKTGRNIMIETREKLSKFFIQ